jgi:uncharacterized membrane protein
MTIIKKYVYIVIGLCIVLLPAYVFAQSGNTSVTGIIKLIQFVLKSLFPILVSLAGIVFMYQVVRFIMIQDVKSREQYRKSVISNLLILVVLLGFWGIIAIASNTLGLAIGSDAIVAGGNKLGSWSNCKNITNTTASTCSVRDLIGGSVKFIGTTVAPIIMAAAALSFMYNVVIYMTKTDNEAERTNARSYIFWSLLALMVMLTVMSIVSIGTKTLFGSSSFIPQFSTSE